MNYVEIHAKAIAHVGPIIVTGKALRRRPRAGRGRRHVRTTYDHDPDAWNDREHLER
jgi:hypothetical protein